MYKQNYVTEFCVLTNTIQHNRISVGHYECIIFSFGKDAKWFRQLHVGKGLEPLKDKGQSKIENTKQEGVKTTNSQSHTSRHVRSTVRKTTTQLN